MKNYFVYDKELTTRTSLLIKQRSRRQKVLNLVNVSHVNTGDILVVIFWKEAIIYRFEGICISIKKKSLAKPDVTLILRNIVMGVGIEFTVSYFYNRVYFLTVSDYKRKQFLYKKSKLYYLRQKLNRASRVK